MFCTHRICLCHECFHQNTFICRILLFEYFYICECPINHTQSKKTKKQQMNGLPAQMRAFGLSIRVINPLYLLFHLVYQKSCVPNTHPKLWSLQPFLSQMNNLMNM